MGVILKQTIANSSRTKIILIVIVMVFAWSGFLDLWGEQLTEGSIAEAGAIYATARGINALISVLQTTTVSPVIGSISLGEMLDPVNDMIERFSTVMTWSIGSLVLQKIMAGIVSKTVFQILLSIVAALAVAGLFVKRIPILRKAWHLFILVAFVRFSIALMLILNAWVGQVFLQTYIQENQSELAKFESEISLHQQSVTGGESGDFGDIAALNDEIEQLQKEKIDMGELLATRNRKLVLLNDAAGRWWWDKALGTRNTQEIQKLTASILRASNLIEEIEVLLESRSAALECLEMQEKGETCGWFNWVPKFEVPSISVFNDLKQTFTYVSQNLIILLVALMLRCLIFPLMFLLLFRRVFLRIANLK